MGTVDKLLDCRRRRAEIEKGGGEDKIKLQHDAGKKTARERVLTLLDEGSFIETDAFASFGSKADANAEGVITGYGSVDGRLTFVYAQDVTVIGAALGEMQAKKIIKVMDMAAKMGAPIVAMIDSNGLRLKEGLMSLAGYGEIFKRNVALSGVVPQITAVMGNCAGAFSFAPALSDFVFMVDGTSEMFVNSAKVIEGVTGEKTDDISSADVHSKKSGECHFKASNDDECIAMIRKLISYLPSNNLEDAPVDIADDINRISETLTNLIPDDADGEYDVKVAISEIVDLGSFMEVLPEYAENIVTGFARMNGLTVGVVVNNGLLDIKASNKAARFVRFLDSFNIPVITLTDVAGYKECACQELRGLSSHASKLLYAYAEATVPKVNVVLRKAYGAAYLAMCSKHIGADLVLAWPTAEITPLSPEAAANLIYADEIGESEDPIKARKEKIEEYRENDANPYEAAKMGFVDDVIEPDSTRPRIIAALEMLMSKRETALSKKHGNIPM